MTQVTTQPDAVGQRLRYAREQAGLSQGQVARLINFHRPTISQIEAGKRRVNSDEIATFADLYSVQEAWIIKGESGLADDSDPRIGLIARELTKLRKEDLESISRLIKVLKSNKEV